MSFTVSAIGKLWQLALESLEQLRAAMESFGVRVWF